MADNVSVEAKGIKEIMQMFNGLPKRVNKDAVWGRFWKKVTKPMLTAAANEAPLLDPGTTGRVGVSYNRTKGEKKEGAKTLTIARGTLKKSVQYGHRNRDGSMSKKNPWMARAFSNTSGVVLQNGFTDAEKIFVKAVAADVRRMKKYGALGY
mgnify:CR=1 FL=1